LPDKRRNLARPRPRHGGPLRVIEVEPLDLHVSTAAAIALYQLASS
jgi:hypothetical protein